MAVNFILNFMRNPNMNLILWSKVIRIKPGGDMQQHFWIPHEILYAIDTHIEYPKFDFHSASFGKLRLLS